jgi:Tfp pilus assembly protein PilF
MYRKGNAFNDSVAVDDALQIAEDAMLLEEVQDVPGPLRGQSRNYRFALNSFLADLYLEKALAAKELDTDADVQDYIQKAEERIGEIVDVLGSTDNPTVQKYQGLVALAKGQQSEGVQLLYKAYEAAKALDKPGERSNVDSRVCMALARIAKQQGQFGMQNEFLSGAFASQDGYLLQNPQLLLEYAQVAKQFGGWRVVKQLAQVYQDRYGANEQSRTLEIEASIALEEFDKAKELISSYEGSPAVKRRYELTIVGRQTVRLKQTIASLKEQGEEPTPEQTQELKTLREKRSGLLAEILKTSPQELDSQVLSRICADLIQNEQAQLAIEYLDTYLSANPDVLNLMVLRLQAQQDDPMNLTSEKRMELQEQAINSLSDAKTKVLLLARLYQSQGEFEKATQALDQSSQVDSDDPDVVQLKFDLALEQKDFQTAESLQQVIRTGNMDQCEGNLAAARMEMVKGNDQLALRRLDECLSLRPLLSYSHFLKSQVQRQLGDEQGAIESARRAVEMDPQNASYMRQLASLFFARNTALGNKVTLEQQAEAERAVGMAIRLNPDDPQLQGVYSEIIKQRDPDQALLIRRRLLENNPSASNALMLGQMALQMADSEWDAAKKTGLIELAGSAYQQGMEAEPDNEILRQAYADYQQKTGKEDAIELLGGDKNLEWKFYLRNSQFEQAETILKELLQEKPDDPLLVRGLVFVSQGAGNRDQVRDYLDMLSELDETKETELWVIQKYIDNGFTAEAEMKLESFKERYPEEKSILLIEAWTEMSKGRLDEALALANRYLETETNNPGVWRLRGRLYRLMNQPQKAIDDLQYSKGLKDTPQVRMELAAVYDESKQATAAIGELASTLDDPQAPAKMRSTLEGLYQRNNRFRDLEKLYDSTLEKYPQSVFWHNRVSGYYLKRKDLAKALELSKKSWELSLERKQPNKRSLELYLESLFQAQQYDKAMTVASGTIDIPALAPTAYAFMAQIQSERGQKDKAVESFYKALEKSESTDTALDGIMGVMLRTVGVQPVTAWISKELAENEKPLKAHILASSLAQGRGSYNEAIEHIDHCTDILSKESPEWEVLALRKVNLQIMAYVKTGDKVYFKSAIDLLSEMLQVLPNNGSLMNNLAYLLTDNDQQLETALEYARKAHQTDPGNANYLDTYAYAQCKNGQYEQAEQSLIRSIQIYDVSGQSIPWDLYEHFGMAKEGLEKSAQAIEMYQKALGASDGIPEEGKQRLQAAIERLQQTE